MFYIITYVLLVFSLGVNGNMTQTSVRHFPKDCGKTRFDSPRIIGGEVAELGQFPWIVRIGAQRRYSKSFFCGGSLVSRYYVITAAHCDPNMSNLVRVGENYLDTTTDCSKGVCAPPHQDIKITRFVVHHKYCARDNINDMALVELETPAKFNDFVQPICFPANRLPDNDLRDGNAIIAGWGLIQSKPEKRTNDLMYIYAPLVDKRQCDNIYSGTLLNNQLCMGYSQGQDSCNGDSGGPVSKVMSLTKTKKRAFLRGLVSYGLSICGKGPAVYTDVTHFVDWVNNNVRKS